MSLSVFTIVPVLALAYVLGVCPSNAFSVNDCMSDGRYNADNVIHVSEASIDPSYFVAPGVVSAKVNFEILQNVTSDLDLSVHVMKKVWWFWATGHRSTRSLCETLDTAFLEDDGTTNCPSELSSAGIPCRCPFRRGRYSLPWTSFDLIKPDDVPYGKYWVEARLTDPFTGVLKGCHNAEFYISSY
ncbi:ganglioside GM2 activator-like [Ylistrum balloti]|uniref:ganglioside GM2 activator-like n=1 Tax=Ylistrum balloti TaxID=509963 RepID=UPI00290585BF|nr:ganglioside GM2 activator-like [Ylistrum balloti]